MRRLSSALGTDEEIDEGLRALASALCGGEAKGEAKGGGRAPGGDEGGAGRLVGLAAAAARHLEKRVCVSRDMGAPAAAALREVARALTAAEDGAGGALTRELL